MNYKLNYMCLKRGVSLILGFFDCSFSSVNLSLPSWVGNRYRYRIPMYFKIPIPIPSRYSKYRKIPKTEEKIPKNDKSVFNLHEFIFYSRPIYTTLPLSVYSRVFRLFWAFFT